MEATEKELATLVEKSTRRKVKKEATVESSADYECSIASLGRRLDDFEEFVKLWEPKF
jgi:hypothetical protein